MLLLISALISVVNIALPSCIHRSTTEVRCLQVSYSIPIVGSDGTLIDNSNFFNIYYYKDLVLFQFRTRYDSTFNGQLVKEVFRHSYVVFNRNDAYGITYDPYDSAKDNKRVRVDSILEKRGLQNFKWEMITQFKPIQSTYHKTTGILEEVYVPAVGKEGLSKDTIRFYYTTRLTEFDYSFSRKIDSLKGIKLFRIEIQYSAAFDTVHKIAVPKRKTWLEMRAVPVNDKNAIMQYFRWYTQSTPAQ
ncbi:MAG: hypothetical protein M3342_09040 [Bacteroidota bacterium]|nr:hypothetical protein [Bacteroidota bacterium]